MTKIVMKCLHCKRGIKRFQKARGRRLTYCSAACRQKAYRKRESVPTPLRLLNSDLFAIKDRTARGNGAIKVLEELGYEVTLTKRSRPSPKPRSTHLQIIRSDHD